VAVILDSDRVCVNLTSVWISSLYLVPAGDITTFPIMDPTIAPPPRQPLSYGQACVGCSKAKCRCVRRPGSAGAKCDRCQRLAISCQPSMALRRRGGRPQNRTAQLEDKLDDLVTLLRSQAQHSVALDTTTSVQRAAPPSQIPAVASTHPPSVSCQQQNIQASGGSPISDLFNATPSTISSDNDFGEQYHFDAEEDLLFFRAVYLPAFPLLFIPVEIRYA
jgi:hypothetical protein